MKPTHSAKMLFVCSALAFAPFIHAASTMLATGAAPRTGEIQWINLTGYDHATAASPTGQNFSNDLPDGRKLDFVLKHTNNAPSQIGTSVNYGLAAFPANATSSFGNVGYTGLTGEPIIYGRHSGTVEISSIKVTSTNGDEFGFEWVAADAETTGWSLATNRREHVRFVTDGTPWTLITNLNRVNPPDGSSLQEAAYSADGLAVTARSSQQTWNAPTPSNPEGGAMVFSTNRPNIFKFEYGSDKPDIDSTVAVYSRQAAAFGIVVTSVDLQTSAPSTVTGNVGQPITVPSTCTNAGPDAAVNATCVVTGIPAAANPVTTCTPSGAQSSLAKDAVINCTTTFTPTTSDPVTIVTIAKSDTYDSNLSNNTATTTLNLPLAADMQATGPATVPGEPGKPLKVVTLCANAGPDAAVNATCEVNGAPAGSNAVTICTPSSPVASLAIGATIQCETTLTPRDSTPITLITTAHSDTFDPKTANNTANSTVNAASANGVTPVPVDARWMLVLLSLVLTGFVWRKKQQG